MKRILLLGLILQATLAFSQNPTNLTYDVTNVTTIINQTTLQPSMNFFEIAVTADNHYLIAGNGMGLVTFDGKNWSQATVGNTDTAINDNYINAIDIADDGTIWLGNAAAGILKITPTDTTIYNTVTSPIPDNVVNDLVVDDKGWVWLAMASQGVVRFNGAQWKSWGTIDNVPSNIVKSIAFDETTGDIWVGTQNGAAVFDGLVWTKHDMASGLPNNNVLEVNVSPTGEVWCGTLGGGIGVYNGTAWSIHNQASGVPNNFVSAIAFDGQGGVYCGTFSAGVGYYDGTSWSNVTGVQGVNVKDINVDHKGNVLITISDGQDKNFSMYNANGMEFCVTFSNVQDVNCTGESTGGASADALFGDPTYLYDWDNGSTTQSISGVAAGTYNVTITDNNNWTGTGSVTITEPATALSVDNTGSNPISAQDSTDGKAWADVSGGTPPYTYVWESSTQQINGGDTVSGLAPDDYTVTVTDDLGCTATGNVTVVDPYVGIETVQRNDILFTVSPNPVLHNMSINLSFLSSETTTLDVILTNVAGQTVRQVLNTNPQRSGTYSINWDVSQLPTGIYVLHVQTDQAFAAKKILISK